MQKWLIVIFFSLLMRHMMIKRKEFDLKKDLEDRIETCFFAIQEAWKLKDMSLAKGFVTNKLYNKLAFRSKFSFYRIKKYKKQEIYIENIKGFYLSEDHCHLRVKIFFNVTNYGQGIFKSYEKTLSYQIWEFRFEEGIWVASKTNAYLDHFLLP